MMVKFLPVCALAFLVLSQECLLNAAREEVKPNILLILADDLGWSDLGCYGGEIKTPNIDNLARSGLRFTQFYNSARCCPSRASLLTGLYPHQAGVGGMNNDRGAQHPGYRGTLQPNTVTIAEVLRDVGYRTYMVGKWHLHNQQDIKPTDRGFDEFYGMLGGFNSCWEEEPYYTRLPANREKRLYTSAKNGQPGTFYSTDVFADYAIDFINDAANQKKPFFLYLAFNAPHFPLHAYEQDIEKYEPIYFEKGWDRLRQERFERQKQLGLIEKDIALPPRSYVPPKLHSRESPFAGKENPEWSSLPEDRRRDLARRMAVYAAMVERLDQAVGRVISELKKSGQYENTLIIFLSDNGACWEWDPYGFDISSGPKNILHTGDDLKKVGLPGSYVSYGSAWANLCNMPFKMYKHFCYEGGIRTPFIINWQGKIKTPGELRQQAGHIIDIMPTILEAVGAKYPAERNGVKIQKLEGVSLLPAINNKPLKRKAPLFFEHEGSRAVIDGDLKLVSLTGDFWELYNIKQDPTETTDLSRRFKSEVDELSKKWELWARRCNVELLGFEWVIESPQIANKQIKIECNVEPESDSGVILAQGGDKNGYALYLEKDKVHFAVRIDGKLFTINSAVMPRRGFSLRATLEKDGTMALSINGNISVKGRAPGLILVQPKDELDIGYDSKSAVGNYKPPFALHGKVNNINIVTE